MEIVWTKGDPWNLCLDPMPEEDEELLVASFLAFLQSATEAWWTHI